MRGKKPVTKAIPTRPVHSKGQFPGTTHKQEESETKHTSLGKRETLNNNHTRINKKKSTKGRPQMNKEGKECVLRRRGGAVSQQRKGVGLGWS